MTKQHPLTDELIQDIEDKIHDYVLLGEDVETNSMRAAYDLAVDKAVDEFGCVLYVISQNYGDILDEQDIYDLVREFREAMRPTTTQEDN